MQRTRLNLLIDQSVSKIDIFFLNPWRRIALLVISFLLGIVMGTAVTTTAGQIAYLDVVVAVLLILFTETVSMFVYSRKKNKLNQGHHNSILISSLNCLKIGLTLGLYIEALKLAT
jgi:uncharacterized membrane protein YoaK (UPF0700 family)